MRFCEWRMLLVTDSQIHKSLRCNIFQTHIYRNQLDGPHYSHTVVDKFFSASVVVDGVKYASTLRWVMGSCTCNLKLNLC